MKKIMIVQLTFIFLMVFVSCGNKNEKKEVKDVESVVEANTLSRITVKGNSFVSVQGDTIVFRGLDASDPDKLQKDGRWNLEYFKEMKSWGATVTRFPVHPKAWRERGKEAYLKLIDDGLAWAAEVGMYVIIDWHSIGNLKDDKYYLPMYETTMLETEDFWRTMAVAYKDNETAAFFELFNEPTLNNGDLGECTWGEWKVLMERLIAVIRENGCEAIPLVAGFNWGYDLTPLKENPIAAEGIGYISHPYPQKREKPWEVKWTEDWGFAAEKYPLILSEIGFCGPDDKGAHIPVISDESYGDAITKYADERGISYTVWVFDPDWSPMLFTDWDYAPSRQGRYFKKVLQGYREN
ncbi:glycoside hydrolase family 5 protein [Lutibacter sp. A80]|uniref:glycoside hydrolase family 5 protein n=1 Tax=Lutibacter sp. A80 TaxID=2918453 RepID=UPI001F06950C|nr:cellulase family glycosylhydrolase [Lutibacter sp. A80]UMB60207.1 glycoside hydrolase family 5 protein [Lutibacter sp. A80]